MKEEQLIEDAQEFTIDESISKVFHNGSLHYDQHKVKGVIMPLRFQFKKVFESRSMLANVLENIKNQLLNTKSVKNFVQGELWKKKCEMYPGKQLIPYFLYNDEFEVNNPLGSHSGQHSVSNVYYSFPCLSEKESKLEYVYLGAVIKSKDVKSFGNEKCWKTLVDELIDLEVNGVDILTENGVSRVYFILGLVLGDNLGLNSFLNFNRSFVSTSFCRFCKMNKLETHTANVENISLMLSEINYQVDVTENLSSESGIRKISLLNEIPSFHVVDNYSVDVMHDVFEGVCHYDLTHALTYFMETAKYFNLETLNSRKSNFDYGPIEIDNTSGDITTTHLSKKHLKMSAREMMTFAYCFPLMIGDLVPQDDEVWKFILNFFEIIDMILCYEINTAIIDLFRHKISMHNTDYVRLFNDNLKAKHHNLTHYPTVLRKSGPLKAFWCFKYESKHRQFKVYSHATTSRKNICLSLARKYQLQFAYSIVEPTINDGWYTINESDQTKSGYDSIISRILKVSNTSVKSFSKTKCNGYMFKSGFYVAVYENDIEIYLILNIFMVEINSIALFCQKLNMIEYNPHYLAYDIVQGQLGEFSIINIKDLVGPPLTKIKTSRGRTMIKVKEYYSANII
ncbi:uncharacterized protein LOC129942757 [Eupeodes corollae]|uniref:uncharacterized protein LOC129942757 n=1 Tax=Eupeodes corollae TaxID=290404 RepID=UPI0024918934|nr:uncharacterized protein LOC129942757 [Eupeodes corollae]